MTKMGQFDRKNRTFKRKTGEKTNAEMKEPSLTAQNNRKRKKSGQESVFLTQGPEPGERTYGTVTPSLRAPMPKVCDYKLQYCGALKSISKFDTSMSTKKAFT